MTANELLFPILDGTPEEEKYTRKLSELLSQRIAENYPPGKTLRALHPKEHGFVKAKFIVERDLPKKWRIGVFKEPRAYHAVIRFSNANPSVSPDNSKDARGMAIRLRGVTGEKLLHDPSDPNSVDLVTISFDSFFARDPKDLFFFTKAFFAGTAGQLRYFLNPFDPHIRQMINLFSAKQRNTSPLDTRYWSMTPYLFGNRAVKYSVAPWLHSPASIPKRATPNYLRENMQRQLCRDSFFFDFMVQFQTDVDKMPIENPLIRWDEKISPFHKLATIVIPRQHFDGAREMEEGDNLSFNPWHCLPEHRPLGGINRSRKKVYEVTSEVRHRRNQTAEVESAANFEPEPFGDERSPKMLVER